MGSPLKAVGKGFYLWTAPILADRGAPGVAPIRLRATEGRSPRAPEPWYGQAPPRRAVLVLLRPLCCRPDGNLRLYRHVLDMGERQESTRRDHLVTGADEPRRKLIPTSSSSGPCSDSERAR